MRLLSFILILFVSLNLKGNELVEFKENLAGLTSDTKEFIDIVKEGKNAVLSQVDSTSFQSECDAHKQHFQNLLTLILAIENDLKKQNLLLSSIEDSWNNYDQEAVSRDTKLFVRKRDEIILDIESFNELGNRGNALAACQKTQQVNSSNGYKRGDIAYICNKNDKFLWVVGKDSWISCPVRILDDSAGGSVKVLGIEFCCTNNCYGDSINRGEEQWVSSGLLWSSSSSCVNQ